MHGDSASPSSDLGAKDRPFNHLSREKSPYLRQHARNPVDWYPWGEEAFRRAVDEDKPIFLSIGYATCHWCHVMARESFEDDAVAAILNEHFITIKVDREERPDIDRVYIMVCQQMTGQGGWPLTVFLTPQKEPFFAGTYFPRSARGGMTGLLELLPRIVSLWKEQRGDLELSAQKITLALGRTTAHLSKGTIDTYLLTRGYEDLAARFDPVNGGFGRAPKFPTPTMLFFLLRYWKRTGSAPALKMVQETLGAIRCGGIHDHLGGGFHRYSTDAGWQVPHFEKMLYDQALLIMAFTEAWQATKKQDYLDTAEGIASYLLRDLQSAEGGFISAEDADNDEGEGAYYVWTREEFDNVLGRKDGAFAAGVFGVTETGNFMVPESGRRANVLFLDCQAAGGVPVNDQSRVERIRTLLFAARDQRPRPPRDDKVLTDWNGLGIAALAQLFRVSGNRIYLTAAERAMHFVLSQLKNPDSGLFHRYCDGEAGILAFADDYAFTIQALIELYESGFEPWYLKEATRLENFVTAHFHDPLHGGYFTTPAGSDPLIIRTKETSDGATPSCNSVMLENLVRLGHLTGDFTFHERASDLAATIARQAAESLSAHTAYLCGLDHLLGPSTIIVITGDSRAADLPEMIQQIWQMYLPSATILCKTPEISSGLDTIAPFTRTMIARDGRATAYICHGTTCSAPVTRIEDLISQLAGNKER